MKFSLKISIMSILAGEWPSWSIRSFTSLWGSYSSPHCARSGSIRLRRIGGPERDRTADLMLAKHALSQLSYRPKFAKQIWSWASVKKCEWLASILAGEWPSCVLRSFASLLRIRTILNKVKNLVASLRSFRTNFAEGKIGGPKWGRTTDLCVISTAL